MAGVDIGAITAAARLHPATSVGRPALGRRPSAGISPASIGRDIWRRWRRRWQPVGGGLGSVIGGLTTGVAAAGPVVAPSHAGIRCGGAHGLGIGIGGSVARQHASTAFFGGKTAAAAASSRL